MTEEDDDPADWSETPRVIVFATEENVKELARAKTWFLDGTFKTAPNIFLQLLTIHGIVRDHPFPLVYALLPNKTTDSYSAVLFRSNFVL